MLCKNSPQKIKGSLTEKSGWSVYPHVSFKCTCVSISSPPSSRVSTDSHGYLISDAASFRASNEPSRRLKWEWEVDVKLGCQHKCHKGLVALRICANQPHHNFFVKVRVYTFMFSIAAASHLRVWTAPEKLLLIRRGPI